MGLPWATLLLHGPAIVDAARKLYASTRKPATPGDAADERALQHALATLEDRQQQQAAVLADLARQVQELTAAVGVLRARVTVAVAATALLAVLGVALAALALAR
jgi:hypothetical protein